MLIERNISKLYGTFERPKVEYPSQTKSSANGESVRRNVICAHGTAEFINICTPLKLSEFSGKILKCKESMFETLRLG